MTVFSNSLTCPAIPESLWLLIALIDATGSTAETPVVVSLLNDDIAEKRRTDPVFGDQRPIGHARMSFS